MGQKTSRVQVYKNAASPTDDGRRSCITGPLDGFIQYDALWDQLIELLRNPTDVAGLHDPAVTQVSETEFTISKTLDMKQFDVKAMHNLGLHRLLLDNSMLTKWTAQDTKFTERYLFDKSNGRIRAERFGPINELVERSWTVLLRDPLRVEFWIEVPGFRRCGPVILHAARWKLLNPAIKRLFGDGYMWQMFKGRGEAKDFLKESAESPLQPGTYSVVSDPLDDIVDFEALWAATVDVLRYPEPQEDKDWEKAEVDQISDTEFTVRRVFDPNHPKVEEVKPYNTWDKVRLDKPNGAIVADTFNSEGVLQITTWYVIHRQPVRVECWCEGPPKRKAGSFVKMRLLHMVGIVLERSEVADNITRTITDMADLDTFEDAEEVAADTAQESEAPEAAPNLGTEARERSEPEAKPTAEVMAAWRSRRTKLDEVEKAFREKEAAQLAGRARQAERARRAEQAQQARGSDEYFECET